MITDVKHGSAEPLVWRDDAVSNSPPLGPNLAGPAARSANFTPIVDRRKGRARHGAPRE